MSTKPGNRTVAYTQDESGIECSPGACAQACGACLMFLMSLVAIASLGVIAGGSFWTAQSMYRVTSNSHRVNAILCSSPGTSFTPPSGFSTNLLTSAGALSACPP